MDDIFKSKDDEKREEKINNLFKSSPDLKKELSQMIPEKETIIPATTEEKKSPKIFLNILMIILFLGLAGAAGYFFWQYKKAVSVSQIIPKSEAETIAEKVKAFTELPEGVPAITTITEQEKFISEPFFSKALNGDKILLYIQAKKAILYRPSSNEVLGVTDLLAQPLPGIEPKTEPVSSDENDSEQVAKIENKVKIDVLNGTEIKGLAKETADKFSSTTNVELAKVGNAQKNTYTKNLVIDLSGKNEVAAKIIAEKISGEVGLLPEGEIKGTADILVIAGKL